MLLRPAILLAALTACATAAVRSGHAAAAWLAATATCQPGQTVQTAIRMVVDDSWHTYWLNPGEAGVKMSVEWQLPPGWHAGAVEHPVPRRFLTSGLAGFGYTGEVLFPVMLTTPPDFVGTARLACVVSWLTCGDAGCVPGEARLTLELADGAPVPTADAPAIRAALMEIPRPPTDGSRLEVTEKSASLVLTLATPGHGLDPPRCEVFPATPRVIEPAAEIRFARHGNQWIANVRKSEFATSPVKQLTLVLAGKGASPPVELSWSAP